MKLVWDTTTKKFKDEGVTITSKYGVEGAIVDSYAYIKSNLTSKLGYRPDQWEQINYDFRKGPAQWSTFDFPKMKTAIEKLYNTHKQQVIIKSISMGGPYTKTFLQRQTQAWKNKYIAGWVSMGGVFSGAMELVLNSFSGDPAMKMVSWIKLTGSDDDDSLRQATASWPGMSLLTPAPFGTGNTTKDAKQVI